MSRSLTAGLAVGAVLTVGVAPVTAFDQPANLRSHNGVLRTTLVAQEGVADMAGKRVAGTMTYNGKFPGPTMNVAPGDRIELKFVNRTSKPTNIHFHGLHVSPSGIADNVLRTFAPGSTNRVVVKIPKDHANGLYWYHPHLHTYVNDQVLRGLAGMISIQGGKEQLEQLSSYRQRLIALNLVQFNDTGTAVINPNDQNDATATTTVNGKLNQVIKMKPGETELWRVANMSNEGFYQLNLQGHEMWIVGQDGTPTRRAKPVDKLVVAPGARYEVLVKASRKHGSYSFRQQVHSDGFNTFPAQHLLELKVAGKATSSAPIPHTIKPFEDLRKARVSVRRKWVLSFGSHPFTSLINGKTFDPDRVDTRAKLGAVEEWTFINQTTQAHPMHIHTNDFQVTKINGKPVDANGFNDDVIVPPSGSLVFRMKPETFTGLTVFHCHILFHEDKGMMATVRYVNSGPNVKVRAPSEISMHEQVEAASQLFTSGSQAVPAAPSSSSVQAVTSKAAPATPGEPARRDPLAYDAQHPIYGVCRLTTT